MSAAVRFGESSSLTALFPRTGFVACRLGFGGAAIGLTNYLGVYDAAATQTRDVATSALRDALAQGVNYFDTAPGYGGGLSEEIMGEALADAPGAFIATKVQPASFGKTRESLEASLKRLRRDRIDLLQFHGTSIDRELTAAILRRGGMAEEMAKLRDEGLVRAIGFTTEDNNAGVYELIDSGLFDSMQIAYNLLLQHPCEPTRPFGSLFEAKKRGMFTITMRTLTSGIFQKWMRLVNPDDRFDYNAALLQFVLSNPLIDVALVGMRTPADVTASMRAWRDESGRIDVAELWGRYVSDEKR